MPQSEMTFNEIYENLCADQATSSEETREVKRVYNFGHGIHFLVVSAPDGADIYDGADGGIRLITVTAREACLFLHGAYWASKLVDEGSVEEDR